MELTWIKTWENKHKQYGFALVEFAGVFSVVALHDHSYQNGDVTKKDIEDIIAFLQSVKKHAE